jgi:hypothetical protein
MATVHLGSDYNDVINCGGGSRASAMVRLQAGLARGSAGANGKGEGGAQAHPGAHGRLSEATECRGRRNPAMASSVADEWNR